MRAMTVAFASVRRWNPEADLELISNALPEPRHLSNLRGLGVEYKYVPFDHRPPEGFANIFAASLYLLDALSVLSSETTLLLDPDVLCIRGVKDLLRDLDGHVGALDMGFPPSEDINGLTRASAGALHAELGEPAAEPLHYGGEAYVIPREHAELISTRSEAAWKLALRRHAEGLPKFTTEEHILSYALRGVALKPLNGYVRRIWTTHRYRQVLGDESQLTLWHLPAEKDRGFRALYGPSLDSNSWFWTADQAKFTDRCGRAMGLHHRTPLRLAKDVAGRSVYTAQRLLHR